MRSRSLSSSACINAGDDLRISCVELVISDLRSHSFHMSFIRHLLAFSKNLPLATYRYGQQ
jgi:hypothetical protein